MQKLENMESLVEAVLEEYPVTRNDDCLLMLGVCKKSGIDIYNMSYRDVMANHHKLRLPNWETVTRCRRKIQERRPDLISPQAEKRRRKAESEFRSYSRGGCQ